jgi:hypothetical protein
MTFNEFRHFAHGVSKWQVFIIDDSENHWYYGLEEVLGAQFGDKRVVSFDMTTDIDHGIVCTVDLI